MIMKGAKVLIECLKEQGIDTIFGYPGGTILDIFDELYNNEDVKNILTVHEQGATHAADGYARSTGKVGVVLVTSGPGASNTVTGIATAFMDSIPLVVITGQVARPQLGKSSFQELDIVEIARSITKKTYKVMDPNRLPHIIREAFQVAREGRPGPVVVDIPKDIQQSNVDYYREKISFERHVPIITSCNLKKINEIVKLIKASEKPVILSGGGIINSDAELELKGLAEKMKIPVASSLMGLGGFSGDHPLFMGMAGMHGAQCANYALSKCDLILALGTRFSDRVVCKRDGFAPNAKIVHIDIDPLEFGKNVVPKITLSGDLKYILREINSRLIEKKSTAWNAQIETWKYEFDKLDPYMGKLSPKYVFNKLKELSDNKLIVCTEVGQNQMWTSQYYKFVSPRSFITSGGLGTMGFGLGAAIGAAFGNPDKKVINVAGDGSFKMNMNELATVSKYKVPLIQLILNNRSLGMVKQWQKIFYNNRISYTNITEDVSFTKLAEAFEIKSMVIRSNCEVEAVLKEALKYNGPVVIECFIEDAALAVPMVPIGESIGKSTVSFG